MAGRGTLESAVSSSPQRAAHRSVAGAREGCPLPAARRCCGFVTCPPAAGLRRRSCVQSALLRSLFYGAGPTNSGCVRNWAADIRACRESLVLSVGAAARRAFVVRKSVGLPSISCAAHVIPAIPAIGISPASKRAYEAYVVSGCYRSMEQVAVPKLTRAVR